MRTGSFIDRFYRLSMDYQPKLNARKDTQGKMITKRGLPIDGQSILRNY
jgi:hypothetical protein